MKKCILSTMVLVPLVALAGEPTLEGEPSPRGRPTIGQEGEPAPTGVPGLPDPTPKADSKMMVDVFSDDGIAEILSHNNVSGASIEKTSDDHGVAYNLRVTYSEPGLGPQGPDTHPCFLTAKVSNDGAGNYLVSYQDPVCAQNAPMGFPDFNRGRPSPDLEGEPGAMGFPDMDRGRPSPYAAFQFADSATLVEMFSDANVQAKLAGSSISAFEVQVQPGRDGKTFTLRITYTEPGLGPNGPDTHPCSLSVVASANGGGGYNIGVGEPACAMNAPLGFPGFNPGQEGEPSPRGRPTIGEEGEPAPAGVPGTIEEGEPVEPLDPSEQDNN